MGDFTKLKHIEFPAVLENNHYRGSSFNLLQLACYPLTKQTGHKSVRVQMHVLIDGKINEILEQNQHGISNIRQIDLKLARYYFLLENFGPEDLDDCVVEFDHPREVTVTLEIYTSEI